MPKCPKCNSENIHSEGLSFAINQNNPQKYLYKCRGCGKVFHLSKGEKEQEEKSE
jgi:transposase-like protein